MNLLEATTILVDLAKCQGPEDRKTLQAIRRMEKRLEVLRARHERAAARRRQFDEKCQAYQKLRDEGVSISDAIAGVWRPGEFQSVARNSIINFEKVRNRAEQEKAYAGLAN